MSAVSQIDDVMSAHLSSNWPFVFNLANSIIGVAVLALPFCFKECGVILGFLLMVCSAWLTDVACRLLVKTAFLSKKRSYEYLALHIFGVGGKFTVEMSIIGMLLGSCIAFYIIIGDLSPAIISKLTGVENTPNLRTTLLVLATVFGVLPLGMLRSVDSLSHFSAISLTFYVVFALHVISSAFTNFWSGVWLSKVVYWNLDGLFKCLPIFALSFACQTQLFVINDALPDPSLKHMNSVIRSSVILCAALYFTVGFFGYVAFYDHEISGDVLMNFQPTLMSEIIKFGFVVSTVISFPLVIFPCRASIYTLLCTQRHNLYKTMSTASYIPPLYFKTITIAIVLFTLSVGIAVPNVEFMLSITGATMGSLICFVLPALMTISVTTVSQTKQKYQAQFVLFVGVTILLASTYVTMVTQEQLVQQESVVKLAQPIDQHLNNGNFDLRLRQPLVTEKTNISIVAKQLDNVSVNVINKQQMNKDTQLKSVDEDRRKEPPNPREPIDDAVGKKEPAQHPANVANQSQQLATPPSISPPLAAQVVDSQKRAVVNDSRRDHEQLKPPSVDVAGQVAVQRQDVAVQVLRQPDTQSDKVHANFKQTTNVSETLHQPESHVGNKAVDGDAAVDILAELRRQQEEQKQLIHEQREIVNELRRHENVAHHVHDDHKYQKPHSANERVSDKEVDRRQQTVQERRQQVINDSRPAKHLAASTNPPPHPPRPAAAAAVDNVHQPNINKPVHNEEHARTHNVVVPVHPVLNKRDTNEKEKPRQLAQPDVNRNLPPQPRVVHRSSLPPPQQDVTQADDALL